MNAMAVLFASVLLLPAQTAAQPAVPRNPSKTISKFVVAPIEDVQVPAREPGELVTLVATPGQAVKIGDVLGQVDDQDAQARKLVATSELNSAHEQAESEANVKAAEATVGVALAEWEGSQRIKDRVDKAVSEFELRRYELTYRRSQYQEENARVELAVAKHARSKAAAQLKAVENEIARRVIAAPVNGVVESKYRNAGEWAQAGEPIYRIIQMDRLRVEGMLKAADFLPEDVDGRSVRVTVKTSANTQEQFEATIDFVSQDVDPSGEFLIHAIFDNPQKPNGQWLVRPGLDAEIEILPQRQAPVSAASGPATN